MKQSIETACWLLFFLALCFPGWSDCQVTVTEANVWRQGVMPTPISDLSSVDIRVTLDLAYATVLKQVCETSALPVAQRVSSLLAVTCIFLWIMGRDRTIDPGSWRMGLACLAASPAFMLLPIQGGADPWLLCLATILVRPRSFWQALLAGIVLGLLTSSALLLLGWITIVFARFVMAGGMTSRQGAMTVSAVALLLAILCLVRIGTVFAYMERYEFLFFAAGIASVLSFVSRSTGKKEWAILALVLVAGSEKVIMIRSVIPELNLATSDRPLGKSIASLWPAEMSAETDLVLTPLCQYYLGRFPTIWNGKEPTARTVFAREPGELAKRCETLGSYEFGGEFESSAGRWSFWRRRDSFTPAPASQSLVSRLQSIR